MELFAGAFIKAPRFTCQEKKKRKCFELGQSPGLVAAAQQHAELHPFCLVPARCVTVGAVEVLLK